MKLIVELQSDLCPGSGEGFAGVVDSDINYESNGLPYIPAKRLKGCLREAALEIVDVLSEYDSAFKKLFGETGQEKTCGLKLGNGYLPAHDEYSSELNHRKLPHNAVLDLFTTIRVRTAMEDGRAKPNSLRSMRVINRTSSFENHDEKVKFEFLVSFPADCKDFFNLCCKSLRSMGQNRTRGLGEVQCFLDCESDKKSETSVVSGLKIIACAQERCVLPFKMKLLEPVLVASRYGTNEKSEEYIFGSNILGILASRWIENHPNVSEPNKNSEFRRLFLEGDVVFTACFPYENGKTYYPTPFTIKTNKSKDRFADESCGVKQNTDEKDPICRKLGGFSSIVGNQIAVRNVSQDVFSHHSRPADRSIGSAMGGGANGGQFYSYRAISKGENFVGKIIGKKEDIAILTKLIVQNPIAYIGRSRTAQYGKVEFFGENSGNSQDDLNIPIGREVRLIFRTPTVLVNDAGDITADARLLPSQIKELCGFKISKIICTETVASGYNAKWRLPRPQMRAISEGSVVILENDSGETKLLKPEYFVGLRTNEGFGQIIMEQVEETDYQKDETDRHSTDGNETELNVLHTAIERKKAIAEVANKGIQEAEKISGLNNSNVSRVLSFIDKADSWEELTNEVEEIKRTELKKKVKKLIGAYSHDDFELYKSWLKACLVQIKQNNRMRGGESQ